MLRRRAGDRAAVYAAAAAVAVAVAVAAACSYEASEHQPVVPALAAAAAAPDSAGAPPAAAPASRLAGMRLDGLTARGHAVVLEFGAHRGGGGDGGAGGPAQPAALALEGGLVRTESGPIPLGGDGARVMVTGGGTIVVHSTDRPAVLFAVPSEPGRGGGGNADGGGRYAVTAHVPSGSGGGFEVAAFEATLGPSGAGGAGGSGAPTPEAAGAAPAAANAGAGDDAGADDLPAELAVAVTVTGSVPFGGALVVQGRVYDAKLNDSPAVVPRGPGAVPGAPVQVTVTDRRSGEVVFDQHMVADEAGLFRAEHRWDNTDPAAALDVSVSAGGGAAVERTAFYLGPPAARGHDDS